MAKVLLDRETSRFVLGFLVSLSQVDPNDLVVSFSLVVWPVDLTSAP